MRAFLRTIDGLSRGLAWLAAISLALLAAIILAEVASVALFNTSLTFTWEYGSFLMAFAFFLGLGYTLRTGGHVRVLLVSEHIGATAAHWLDVVATVFALGVVGYLTWALGLLAWSSYRDAAVTFTATATPLAIPQAALTLGAAMLALQLLARLLRLLIGEAPEEAGPGAGDIDLGAS